MCCTCLTLAALPCSYWFKQTMADPATALSNERRGTLVLPDPEGAYRPRAGCKYTAKVRLKGHSPTSGLHLTHDVAAAAPSMSR
jgi:hypothetical protein